MPTKPGEKQTRNSIATQEKVTPEQKLEMMGREELLTKIAELEGIIAEQSETIESLKNQANPKASGRGGWLIQTPNARFDGQTAGVNFRSGKAFIPDGAGAERRAHQLASDFGYQATYVADWQEMPEAPAISRSFIDVLSGGPRNA